MTGEEIIRLVEAETGVRIEPTSRRKHHRTLTARYVAILLMWEEGYSAIKIAGFFAPWLHRTSVYSDLRIIDRLLEGDKEFKILYLACIKRMADTEDNK